MAHSCGSTLLETLHTSLRGAAGNAVNDTVAKMQMGRFLSFIALLGIWLSCMKATLKCKGFVDNIEIDGEEGKTHDHFRIENL